MTLSYIPQMNRVPPVPYFSLSLSKDLDCLSARAGVRSDVAVGLAHGRPSVVESIGRGGVVLGALENEGVEICIPAHQF